MVLCIDCIYHIFIVLVFICPVSAGDEKLVPKSETTHQCFLHTLTNTCKRIKQKKTNKPPTASPPLLAGSARLPTAGYGDV